MCLPPPGPRPPLLPVLVRQAISRAPPVTSVIANVPTSTSPLLPPAGRLSQVDRCSSKPIPTSSLPSSTSVTGPPDPSSLSVSPEVTPPPPPAPQESGDASVQPTGSELEPTNDPSDQDDSSSSDESLDFEDGDMGREEAKMLLEKNVSVHTLLSGSPCWQEDCPGHV